MSFDYDVLVTSSHRCLSTVSFPISLPIHCLHTHHTYYIIRGRGKERGKIFLDIYGIGKYEACFFYKKKEDFFLHVARHPADSDGRPTAEAQVLVRVSIVP